MTNEEKIFIPIIKAREAVKLLVNDIIYIESNGRKISVKTREGTHSAYSKITETEKFLDSRFYKCHSRCIINMEKVVKMKGQQIIFEGGEKIYVSREKFTDTIRFYKAYLLKNRKIIRK
ncbi:MAG: LytTR family DNA-binding domain-containing protein [Eubacteriales bacterium]|nr:LytTR family DNA-binding domain-containing protein [Eubacteriales bacterium]MDD4389290.1 LytTR family DNA-binding domain-containing protein [Eubacteriales bacterium]